MNKYHFKQNQRGFAGVVFLVIALIAIVVAAIALMSRQSSSGAADQGAKANAAVILKQAADLKIAFDRIIASTSVPASAITFDATPTTATVAGVFDPTPGAAYAVKHVPPAGTGATAYFYNNGVKLPGIGAAATADYVVTTAPLNLQSCQAINKSLYGDAATATPASSSGTEAQWTTAPAAIDDSANVATNYALRPEGCVLSATAGSYVYYKAVVEN